MSLENIDYIYIVIVIIFGLTFIFGSIKSKSNAPVWSKRALFLAGLCAITSGLLVIILNTQIVPLNTTVRRLIQSFRPLIGGMTVGILITLLLSSELSFTKKHKVNEDGD